MNIHQISCTDVVLYQHDGLISLGDNKRKNNLENKLALKEICFFVSEGDNVLLLLLLLLLLRHVVTKTLRTKTTVSLNLSWRMSVRPSISFMRPYKIYPIPAILLYSRPARGSAHRGADHQDVAGHSGRQLDRSVYTDPGLLRTHGSLSLLS